MDLNRKEISKKRYSICVKCDKFIIKHKKCSECGCFLKLKVKFLFFKCPLKKW